MPQLPPPPAIVAPIPMLGGDMKGPLAYAHLVTWKAGVADCRGAKIAALRAPKPRSSLVFEGADAAAKSLEFTFKIDRAGRPYSIARQRLPVNEASFEAMELMTFGSIDDLAPTLATTVFPPGSGEMTCTIGYSPEFSKITEASQGDLIEFALAQDDPALGDVRKLLRMPRSNCDGNLTPRVLYFPPLDEISGPPGEISALLVRFAIDANGIPVQTEVLYSSTGQAVETSVLENLGKSRFAPKVRTDCLLPLRRVTPHTLAAPPAPSLPPREPNCPIPAASILSFSEIPFPKNFRRRNVEGWALVRFDVAASGKVGNASVMTAEPAEAFGTQGKKVVEAASAKPRPVGLTGCVARVRFRLDNENLEGVSYPMGELTPATN